VRNKGKFSVKNNAMKLDFLYRWDTANVQEELCVWMKSTQMAKCMQTVFAVENF